MADNRKLPNEHAKGTRRMAPKVADELPSFNFILQPEFPVNALILATEALRIANQNSGRELFRWRLVSEDGAAVRASNGMWIQVDSDLPSMPRAMFTLVFEGNLPTQRNSPKLLNQLRAAARFGGSVGGIDTGTFALAQAGLIGERETVLHWEATPTFHERFPETKTKNQIYLIDGKRISCAGGVATLDMMLELIGRLYDPALANEVADALVHTPRPAQTVQRLGDAVGPRKALSDRIVAVMESNLDFPLDLDGIAAKLGISSRTVVRECRRSFARRRCGSISGSTSRPRATSSFTRSSASRTWRSLAASPIRQSSAAPFALSSSKRRAPSAPASVRSRRRRCGLTSGVFLSTPPRGLDRGVPDQRVHSS